MAHGPSAHALAGVVACGGPSRRMGQDKALIELGGEPLVSRVARRLCTVADPVTTAPGTVGRLAHLGLTEIADSEAGAGPLAGIVAGLAWSPRELVAVAAVDMPFADAELFALLARSMGHADAVVPVTADGPQPLHAVYAAAARPRLESALADGEHGLQRALTRLRVCWVGPSEWAPVDPEGLFATNLNEPADVTAARQRMPGAAAGGCAPC